MKSPSPQTAAGKPSRAHQGERGADRIAGAAADAAAALGADIVERMAERPGGAVPGERDMGERDVALADRGLERAHQIVDHELVGGKLGLSGLAPAPGLRAPTAPPTAVSSSGTASSGVVASITSQTGRP